MEPCLWRTYITQPTSFFASPWVVAALSRLHYHRGEQRLMLAVLIDAIGSIEHYETGRGARSWRTCRAAVEWVTNHDQRWPFSFENICLALDLDPAKLRSALCTEFPALFLTKTPGGTFHPKVSEDRQRVQG